MTEYKEYVSVHTNTKEFSAFLMKRRQCYFFEFRLIVVKSVAPLFISLLFFFLQPRYRALLKTYLDDWTAFSYVTRNNEQRVQILFRHQMIWDHRITVSFYLLLYIFCWGGSGFFLPKYMSLVKQRAGRIVGRPHQMLSDTLFGFTLSIRILPRSTLRFILSTSKNKSPRLIKSMNWQNR